MLSAVVHNMSGHAVLTSPVTRLHRAAAQPVPPRRHFGKGLMLYSSRGNLIFGANDVGVHFKGARDVRALLSLLEDVSDGFVVHLFIGMIVFTVQMQMTVNVQHNGPLHMALLRYNNRHQNSIRYIAQMDVTNTLFFRVMRWDALCNDERSCECLQGCTAVCNVTRHGNCTMRFMCGARKHPTEAVASAAAAQHAVTALAFQLRSELHDEAQSQPLR